MRLIGTEELSSMLKVHPVSLRRMVAKGTIPAGCVLKPFGKCSRLLFDEERIEEWLNTTRKQANAGD